MILTRAGGNRVFVEGRIARQEVTQILADIPSIGPRLWIVDPIDGTRGFAKKNGEFSVMIGFVEDGVIGVGESIGIIADLEKPVSLGDQRGRACAKQGAEVILGRRGGCGAFCG